MEDELENEEEDRGNDGKNQKIKKTMNLLTDLCSV